MIEEAPTPSFENKVVLNLSNPKVMGKIKDLNNGYLYWDKNWREANKLTHGNYDLKCNFKFWIYYAWQDPTVAQRNEETLVRGPTET